MGRIGLIGLTVPQNRPAAPSDSTVFVPCLVKAAKIGGFHEKFKTIRHFI
jgi:hypothetical protein